MAASVFDANGDSVGTACADGLAADCPRGALVEPSLLPLGMVVTVERRAKLAVGALDAGPGPMAMKTTIATMPTTAAIPIEFCTDRIFSLWGALTTRQTLPLEARGKSRSRS